MTTIQTLYLYNPFRISAAENLTIFLCFSCNSEFYFSLWKFWIEKTATSSKFCKNVMSFITKNLVYVARVVVEEFCIVYCGSYIKCYYVINILFRKKNINHFKFERINVSITRLGAYKWIRNYDL